MNSFELALTNDLRAAVARLLDENVPREALATYVPSRKKWLLRRPATMVPVGEVWRLGTLLLMPGAPDATDMTAADTPTLFAAHSTTRSAVRPHPGNQSVSREERRDIAAAAHHGGYPEGTAVNYGATVLELSEVALRGLDEAAPVGVVDGERGPELRVRWRAGAPLDHAATLDAYLSERISLLVERLTAGEAGEA